MKKGIEIKKKEKHQDKLNNNLWGKPEWAPFIIMKAVVQCWGMTYKSRYERASIGLNIMNQSWNEVWIQTYP